MEGIYNPLCKRVTGTPLSLIPSRIAVFSPHEKNTTRHRKAPQTSSIPLLRFYEYFFNDLDTKCGRSSAVSTDKKCLRHIQIFHHAAPNMCFRWPVPFAEATVPSTLGLQSEGWDIESTPRVVNLTPPDRLGWQARPHYRTRRQRWDTSRRGRREACVCWRRTRPKACLTSVLTRERSAHSCAPPAINIPQISRYCS